MHKRSHARVAVAVWVIMGACMAGVSVPAAAQSESPPYRQTFTVIYWPTSVTGQVTFTGNRGTLTGGGTYSQPYVIFDYRLVTPSSLGLHLYYAPLLGASGQANSAVSTAGGLWGGEITYDLVLHPTERSLLILDFIGGYGQQNTNSSVTTALGNTVSLNQITGGVDFGVNAILPLSQQWAVIGSVTYYPWGFANFQLSAPAVGLNASATGSAPQWTYAVAISYKTADQWNFSLGYQWATISVGAIPLATVTGGGETIGGAFCPCNVSLSGFVLSAGKTF